MLYPNEIDFEPAQKLCGVDHLPVARGKGKFSGGKGLHFTSHNPPQEDANSVVSALSNKDDAAENDDEP